MSQADPIFEEHRSEMMGLAYRMLSTLSDADDVLQEAYLRWSREDRSEIRNPRAYLYSLVTRLCIDQLRKQESSKTEYVGPWLPEPVVRSSSDDPQERLATADSISLAFLVALERLSPTERAAYLLRKVFDYEYQEIADVLGKNDTNCRQLVSRAEKMVLSGKPRFVPNYDETQRLTEAFLQACTTGDLSDVVRLLADDAVLYSDGGGKANAARVPIEGAERVARFFVGLVKKFEGRFKTRSLEVNGEPGFLSTFDGAQHSVINFEVVDGRIQKVFVISNPDKLTALPPL